MDATADMPIPTLEQFEVLRLFAMVGANAAETVMLMREVQDLGIEREMKSLRQELQDEVALRGSLLEVGIALGALLFGFIEFGGQVGGDRGAVANQGDVLRCCRSGGNVATLRRHSFRARRP